MRSPADSPAYPSLEVSQLLLNFRACDIAPRHQAGRRNLLELVRVVSLCLSSALDFCTVIRTHVSHGRKLHVWRKSKKAHFLYELAFYTSGDIASEYHSL